MNGRYEEVIASERFERLGKADLYEQELYDELVEAYADKPATAWVIASNKLLDRAGELGAKTMVKDLVVETKKRMQERKKDEAGVGAMSPYAIMEYSANPLDLTEAQLAQSVCLNYSVDEHGIYEVVGAGGRKLFCHTPMAITKQYRNAEDGTIRYDLAYMVIENGEREVRHKVVTAETLSDANLIKKLANEGILVNTNNSKALVDYLTESVANGLRNGMETGTSTSKFGWTKGDRFSPYDDGIVFDGLEKQRQLYEAVTSVKGEPDEYLKHMREVRKKGRLEINVQMAGAMASVMLGKYLQSPPCILHVYGQTDAGKTMSMRVALSQIGDPSEGALMGDYRGSIAGTEARAGCLNNLPLALDDVSKLNDEKKKGLEPLIYDLCAGQGRTLGNKDGGNRDIKKWNCVVLSTAEGPMSSYCTQGGGLNRVFEFPVDKEDLAFDNPEAEIRWLERNHGHVIRPFLAILRSLGEAKITETYERNKADVESHLTEKVLAKQLQPLAIILTADELLTDYVYKDGVYLRDRMPELVAMLKTENQISDGARAYEVLKDVVAGNPRKLYMDDPTCEEAQGEQWGWKPTDDSDVVYLTGTAIKQILAKEGLNAKKFLGWAIKHGVTQADAKGNAPVQYLGQKVAGAKSKRAWAIEMPREATDDELETLRREQAKRVADGLAREPKPAPVENAFYNSTENTREKQNM